MNQSDDDYANASHIPEGPLFPERWARAASAFRDMATARLGLEYGTSPRQKYDLFLPQTTPKGTLVFVHGGFWRAFGRSDWSHLAAGATARGWAVAMPSYDLCPSVRIAMITAQIAAAITKISDEIPGPITLAGHSAGGHLVARMCQPGLLHENTLGRVAHVMPISPLSDLAPLCATSMNADFRLDSAMARAESPVHQPAPDLPVTVWVGADERPAFLDQARWLAEAWHCDHIIAPDKHHFDVIEPLTDPDSEMVRRLTLS